MEIRFTDRRCLAPCLLDARGGGAQRVLGVFERARHDGRERSRALVDALDYDGHRCRYRLGGGGATPRWVVERDGDAYEPFSRLVIDRLCALARTPSFALHRFPEGPPSRALGRRLARLERTGAVAVLDTALTAEGRLWLRGRVIAERVATRVALARSLAGEACRGTAAAVPPGADDGTVEGWLLLAETASDDERVPRPGGDRARVERDVA